MTSKRYSARTLDANALKSFAHPLRLRIYELLDEHGPSTATRLAALLGQNTGATSYHLRELARHGMIEVVAGMGRGKEKYWRITPRRLLLRRPARRSRGGRRARIPAGRPDPPAQRRAGALARGGRPCAGGVVPGQRLRPALTPPHARGGRADAGRGS
ncbi:helix-turn-helix domain-containing protein [Nonomuraea salmonea]|uniref:ArsR/SmtB family transcription factor n=1 Tax=Nonomuraea salmonea TaxID=46181 RepID=UPI002FE9C4B2